MQFFSGNGLILSGTVLFVGLASVNNAKSNQPSGIPVDNQTYTASGSTDRQTAQMLVNLLRNPHLQVKAQAQIANGDQRQRPQSTNDRMYTAHGKTDKKTAEMLINLLRNPHLKVKAQAQIANRDQRQRPQSTNDRVYTAHGKTDKKTAEMLINLLRNPHLKVKAQAQLATRDKSQSLQGSDNNGGNKIYTAHGKTDKRTAEMLKNLLRNPHLRVKAEVHPSIRVPSPTREKFNRAPQGQQQYLYQNYSALIAQRQPFYHNGRPPVFIQGSTLWYPVQVTTQSHANAQVQKVSE